MKKINDFDKIQENSSGYKRLPDGGYIVGIKNVSDDSDKEFLRSSMMPIQGKKSGGREMASLSDRIRRRRFRSLRALSQA